MSPSAMKAMVEAERLRLWRRAVKDHPRMTPAEAEIIEKEIERKLMIFVKSSPRPEPARRPRQTSFAFLRDFPAGPRPGKTKSAR